MKTMAPVCLIIFGAVFFSVASAAPLQMQDRSTLASIKDVLKNALLDGANLKGMQVDKETVNAITDEAEAQLFGNVVKVLRHGNALRKLGERRLPFRDEGAIAEAYKGLSEEAKEQIWPVIVGGAVGGATSTIVNRLLDRVG